MKAAQRHSIVISTVTFQEQFYDLATETLPVTSVTLDLSLPDPLDPPVRLTWAVTDPFKAPGLSNHTSECVWWAWDGLSGAWSTQGCTTDVGAENETVACLCTHLTEYAVRFLPDPNIPTGSDIQKIGDEFNAKLGLKIFQSVLVAVFAALLLVGYVMDKKRQVFSTPCVLLSVSIQAVGGAGAKLGIGEIWHNKSTLNFDAASSGPKPFS